MSDFVPELGQMLFGQPSQQYAVPDIMEAVLMMIDAEYCRVYWNVNQRECPTPFSNNGPQADFKTDVLEVAAYSWGDEQQPFNFAWRDLRISWYKCMGRGMSANKEITPDLTAQCLAECLASVRALDTPDFPAPSASEETNRW